MHLSIKCFGSAQVIGIPGFPGFVCGIVWYWATKDRASKPMAWTANAVRACAGTLTHLVERAALRHEMPGPSAALRLGLGAQLRSPPSHRVG